ncbi:protein FAM8A1-like isoform X2 [Watersipora subatra]
MKEQRTLPLRQYAEELRHWLHLNKMHQTLSMSMCQQAYMIGANCPPLPQQVNSTQSTQANIPNNTPAARPVRAFPEHAGTEVRIPSVWKRVVAEVIDSTLLLFVKLFITYMLMSIGGFEAMQLLDFDYALLNGELDVDKFLNLSSEIMFVEFIHKLFVCIYEAFCLTFVTNIIPPGGATPGKKLMGIAVVGCEEVFTLGGDRFLVTGISTPSLSR